MKRRIHQCILALMFLGLAPVALLAAILAASFLTMVLVTTLWEGVYSDAFPLLGLSLLMTLLAIYPYYRGPDLFFRLYAGFLPGVRKALFEYYAVVTFLFGSCFALLMGDTARGGAASPDLGVVGTCGLALLFIPLVLVLFTKADTLSTTERLKLAAEGERLAK